MVCASLRNVMHEQQGMRNFLPLPVRESPKLEDITDIALGCEASGRMSK